MGQKHNKKRNVGLLYEFLVRHASECLVESNDKHARAAIRLLRKHIFKQGTELYREFRLFHALANTTVEHEKTAHRILEQAKVAASQYDIELLDREKSLLIRGINHTFKDPNFFNKRFDEYRIYATIQSMFNEWRSSSPDISAMVKYEEAVVDWLLTKKGNNILSESNVDGIDALTMQLMIKKVNSKYKNVLNAEQVDILRDYVYSEQTGEQSKLKERLESIRQETLKTVDEYAECNEGSDFLQQRLSDIRAVLNESIDVVDDKTLTRYLRIARLRQEIKGE